MRAYNCSVQVGISSRGVGPVAHINNVIYIGHEEEPEKIQPKTKKYRSIDDPEWEVDDG